MSNRIFCRGSPAINTQEGPVKPGSPTVHRWSRVIPMMTYDFASCNVGSDANFQSPKNRVSQQLMKTAPYVSLKWDGGPQGRAMVDTGADWSLIAEEELTPREKLALRPSRICGRGVSREEIPILGEIFRTLKIGNVTVPDQRFVVVRGLIAGYLGY